MSARRQQLRRDAELLHHLRPESEEAHLQALQIVDRLDLVTEPARCLWADAEAIDRIEIVLGVNLFAELVAAAIPFPGQELAEVRPERHGREEGQGWVFAGVVARRGPARFDGALGDRLETLERRDQSARLVKLDVELAARHALDILGETDARGAKVGERTRERALHLPAHALLRGSIANDGRSGQDGQAREPYLEQAFRHRTPPF